MADSARERHHVFGLFALLGYRFSGCTKIRGFGAANGG
jgi:TnpA family transposase